MKSSKLTRLSLATLVVLVLALTPSSAAATTTTHSPPWADVVNGPMWGGFDPRGAATEAFNYLNSMGYHAFNDNNSVDAGQAIGPLWAKDDAVFVVYGHAGPGQIAVQKSGVTGAITANANLPISPDFTQGVRANLYSQPSNYWSLMKLAVWIGCNTGVDGDSSKVFGWNLVREAVSDMGASSSLGFTHLIYAVPNAMDLWSGAFFHALYEYNGTPDTVAQAADAGVANVRFWWGTANYSWGFADPYILGGNVKITPAAYSAS